MQSGADDLLRLLAQASCHVPGLHEGGGACTLRWTLERVSAITCRLVAGAEASGRAWSWRSRRWMPVRGYTLDSWSAARGAVRAV